MEPKAIFAEMQTSDVAGGGGGNILFPTTELLARFPRGTKLIFLLGTGQLTNGTLATGVRRAAVSRVAAGGATATLGELVDGAILTAAGDTEGWMYALTSEFGETGRTFYQGNAMSINATAADQLIQSALLLLALG